MKEKIKEKFPNWCSNVDTKYDLMITDDIDSLMCYIYQKQKFNRECTAFLDVNHKKVKVNQEGIQRLYCTKNLDFNNIIALDSGLENIKTWDNHVVKTQKDDNYNTESANLNVILDIKKDNYTKKAVISSYITMLSYYGEDLTKWTKEQLCVLCAIDGLYLPFLNTKFESTARYNLDLLECGFLADFIKENIEEIQKTEERLNLKQGKIWVNLWGELQTDIKIRELSKIFRYDIELPEGFYTPFKDYKSFIYTNKNKSDVKGKIFNFVLTYRNNFIVSKEE